MASSNVCWGIELGAGAVKGIKLVRDGDKVSVADFAVIPHKRPLSAPDVDEADAMRVAIGTLVTQHDLSRATLAISIPGHASFSRFAKLPPVEPKQIPGVVRFEAAQQIPFPIDEVEWDYQVFSSEDSPDVEVGIFAVTRERVMDRLSLCADVKLRPDCLALSPVSVFNGVAFDLALTNDSPGTVIIDVGTIATDLIVIEGGRLWIRTFPMGGHAFTEAIETSFKLPYAKAEKLKREAEQSKYKRQIFQAMRPAFADFGQEVQRSLQYYKQLHPDANLKQVIGVGSTFQLPGLRKILGQQLQMDVSRFEQFQMLSVEGPRASDLQSVAMNMVTAYGLALQGLGMATIDANLIPSQVVREGMWQRKTSWFVAAACIALAAGGVSFIRPIMDGGQVAQARQSPEAARVQEATRLAATLRTEWEQARGGVEIGATASNVKALTNRRDLYAHLVSDLGAMLASAGTQPELFDPQRRASVAPADWRMFQLVGFDVNFRTPSGGAPRWTGALPAPGAQPAGGQDRGFEGGGGGGGGMGGGAVRGGGGAGDGGGSMGGGFRARDTGDVGGPAQGAGASAPHGALEITLTVDSPNAGLGAFVDETILAWLREHAERPDSPYKFVVPAGDDVQIRMIRDAQAGAPATSASTPTPATTSDRTPRSGGSSGAQSSAAPRTGLDQVAPLGDIGADFPPAARVYRYVITFQAVLNDPGAADRGGDGGGL